MKKGCKLILFSVVTAIIINIYSPVLARSNKENEYDERIKQISLEVRNMNIETDVKAFMEEGIPREDAEYFIRLNNFVQRLEKENIQILIDETIEDISDEEFLMNKVYYREKILDGDKRSLKKGLQSLDNLFRSNEYAEKVINTFSDKRAFKVMYPDGSKISFDTRGKDSSVKESLHRIKDKDKIEKLSEGIDKVKNKASYKPTKIGYEETMMEENIIYEHDNMTWKEGEWAFESGISFSKVYLYTEFQLNEEGVPNIRYVRGGQSSYGIVNIANSTGAAITRATSCGTDIPAEARNEVVFTVSGSFGASFLIISLAAEPGMNWTQYIIFRLHEGVEREGEYEAKYQWYAAEYK